MKWLNRMIVLSGFLIHNGNDAIAQTNYSLQQALQTAKAHNLSLKTENYNKEIAASDVVTAGLRPNLSLNNQTLQLLQPSHYAPNTNFVNSKNRQNWWQLTKTFQVAGQRDNKIDLANKNVALTASGYQESERQLFYDVASKWLENWTAQKQLDILNVAKNNTDSLLNINQLKYKNQVINQTDLFRTELLSKQYALQLKTARQEIAIKQKELKLLLGIEDSIGIDMKDNFGYYVSSDLDSLLSQSGNIRTDIVAAKSLIDVSNSNIKLQKSLAYPQPEIGLIWNPQNGVHYMGVYATIDLPFFNRNQGEIRKAQVQKEQAEMNLTTVQKSLQSEVAVAYSNYRNQLDNIQKFQPILQQSQSILDNVKYAYIKGGTTIIDFLEAQRSWLDNQQQYYDALEQYRQSYIQLIYTTGLINQLAI